MKREKIQEEIERDRKGKKERKERERK